MTASPMAVSLQSILRSSSPSPLASSSTPSSSRSPARRVGTISTVRPSSGSAPGWGDTLSAAFGYSTQRTSPARGASTPSSNKGKTRAGIPSWYNHENTEEGERTDGVRRGSAASEEACGAEADDKESDEDGQDALEELAETTLWQAGTDHSDPPGPLLVIACSRIPAPTEISHPDLLAKLRLRLEAFASSGPYSIVLLVNPTPHAPATAHLVSTYLSLTRMARKNVRRIYVVGGGWWTRVILTVFSTTLLSTKTAKKRKIVQCGSLSSLAAELGAEPFVQIEFPLEVYSANAVSDSDIKLPLTSPPLPRSFGVPLEELTGKDGDRLPPIVRDCVEVLLSQGPESVGVFRRSPSAAHVKLLEGAYDRGHPVSLSYMPDAPYLAASLFKLFLRSLPAPIFPPSLYPIAKACPLAGVLALPYIRSRILPTLPPPALLLLQQLCAVLSAVTAKAETNLMTSENLVICLVPGLIGGMGATKEEVEMCRVPGMNTGSMKGNRTVNETGSNTLGGVLRVMIDHYSFLFDPSTLSSLAPALRLPLVGDEIDLTPPASALSLSFHATSSRGSFSSSRSPSLHSAPRSPILSIPEDGDPTDGDVPPSLALFPSSPPQSRSSAQAAALSPRRPSTSSVASSSKKPSGETMERSTSLSSLSSNGSFASAASTSFSAATSLTSRTGTLRLKKVGGRSGGAGFLVDAFGSPASPVGGAGGNESGAESVGVGRSGTVRKAKSRGVVTVQGVEGVFVRGATKEGGEEDK
ncbi:hypothetical protein JCM8547_005160 [Rhodosporidiobolus lusitaniae]